MIESGLYQLLMAAPAVTDIVGQNIFPLWRKDMPVPSLIYQGITGSAITSLDGETPLRIRRFQFDCYAPVAKYFTSRQLSAAVRTALVPASGAHGYPYTLPDGTEIQSAKVNLELDMSPEEGTGGYICRSILDIEFVHIPAN